jgi:hypothetical protein
MSCAEPSVYEQVDWEANHTRPYEHYTGVDNQLHVNGPGGFELVAESRGRGTSVFHWRIRVAFLNVASLQVMQRAEPELH